MHTTNYYNTFIEVAEDCPVEAAETPRAKAGKATVPAMQYELIGARPYRYTSDEVLFDIHARRNGLDPADPAERQKFFSKGQPCLRSSPLGKRYGWGIHFDAEGKVALYPRESEAYERLAGDETLAHTRAMRTSRKK
jgi:hypothetical protein